MAVADAVEAGEVGARLRGGDQVVDRNREAAVRQLDVDDRRAPRLQHAKTLVERRLHVVIDAAGEQVPRHTDAKATDVAGERRA
jgi:hypothetical protein